jgi:hypothetical protein
MADRRIIGIAFALSPPPMLVFVGVAIALWPCVLVSAAATLRAVKRADLPRVSDGPTAAPPCQARAFRRAVSSTPGRRVTRSSRPV